MFVLHKLEAAFSVPVFIFQHLCVVYEVMNKPVHASISLLVYGGT